MPAAVRQAQAHTEPTEAMPKLESLNAKSRANHYQIFSGTEIYLAGKMKIWKMYKIYLMKLILKLTAKPGWTKYSFLMRALTK